MDGETSGWLWLAIDVAFVALFAIALIYGIWMWRSARQNSRLKQQRDGATRELYNRGGE
jgi:uncharacterized membrane protein YqjE